MYKEKPVYQETSEDGSKRVSIYYYPDPENPRNDWSNFSHMVCEHRRYSLGDKSRGVVRELQDLCDNYGIDCYGDWREDEEDMTIAEMIKELSKHIVIRPISLYDHSGVSIYYGSPCDPWDSGYVGFGYMERSDVEEVRGKEGDDEWRDSAISIMDHEMEIYNKYINGEVYGFVLEEREVPSKALTETPEWKEFLKDWWNKEFQWEEKDSCWNFYEEPEELASMVLNGQV